MKAHMFGYTVQDIKIEMEAEELLLSKLEPYIAEDLDILKSIRFRKGEKIPTGKIEDYLNRLEDYALFECLVNLENNIEDNYLPCIFLSSLICEKESAIKISDNSKPIGDNLLKILKHENKIFIISGLSAWLDGKVKTTLGITEMVMCAIRYSIINNDELTINHFTTLFTDQFKNSFINKKLLTNLNIIKNEFRNPACHGIKTIYSKDEYKLLNAMIFGTGLVHEWREMQIETNEIDSPVVHNIICLTKPYAHF